MPNYGVIDLGSNSIRLCVYEVDDDGKRYYTKKDFRSLLNNKVIAGLSAHVEDGIFADSGVRHAVDVLKNHSKRVKYFACKDVQVFATAVLRNSSNSQQAIHDIEEKTGLAITLLSETDEAHLGFVGASSGQELIEGTLMDIGGGSTELTSICDGADLDHASIPQGSLSSFAKYVRCILPAEEEAAALLDRLHKRLARLSIRKHYANKMFFGVGGSMRAAAKVYAEVFSLDSRPEILTLEHFDELIAYYQEDPCSFAHYILKAAPDRIHTVIPGCLIARTIMKECRAESLTVCKNGVREGYLIERMLKGQVPGYGRSEGNPGPQQSKKGGPPDGT